MSDFYMTVGISRDEFTQAMTDNIEPAAYVLANFAAAIAPGTMGFDDLMDQLDGDLNYEDEAILVAFCHGVINRFSTSEASTADQNQQNHDDKMDQAILEQFKFELQNITPDCVIDEFRQAGNRWRRSSLGLKPCASTPALTTSSCRAEPCLIKRAG